MRPYGTEGAGTRDLGCARVGYLSEIIRLARTACSSLSFYLSEDYPEVASQKLWKAQIPRGEGLRPSPLKPLTPKALLRLKPTSSSPEKSFPIHTVLSKLRQPVNQVSAKCNLTFRH